MFYVIVNAPNRSPEVDPADGWATIEEARHLLAAEIEETASTKHLCLGVKVGLILSKTARVDQPISVGGFDHTIVEIDDA